MRYSILLITVVFTAGVYTASVLLMDQGNLDFTDRSATYTDAPFDLKEHVAVNVLTNLGVIQGNPDGSFRPSRHLNRAEFVKVAILSHPSASTLVWGPISCFPDTLHQDWFSPYVCAAKEQGVIQGYQDGLFRPAQPVTYAEAIKILAVLYGYTLDETHAAADNWYTRYTDGAKNHKVLLPEDLSYDAPLTRGQMARLAAAFRAEYEGELEVYRSFEGEKSPITNHQSPNNSQIPIFNSESLAPSLDGLGINSASDEVGSVFPLSTSHFLLLGRESLPIADGVFKSPGEDADLAIVQVVLDREVKSIHELTILDEDGVELSWPLRLYGFDEYNRTFRWEFERGTEYKLPANINKRFFVKARLWERGNRGISEELFEVREFSVVLHGRQSSQSLQLFAQDSHFPFHQTVQSVLTAVMNAGKESHDLREGRKEDIGSFKINILDPYNVGITLQHVTFTVDIAGVELRRLELGRLGRSERIPCYSDGLDDESIFCPNLPDEFGSVVEDGATVSLFADITFLPVPDRHLHVSLEDPGAIGRTGSIQWSDRVGTFTWIEGEAPVAVGTYWK